jgi:hypothetical protein
MNRDVHITTYPSTGNAVVRITTPNGYRFDSPEDAVRFAQAYTEKFDSSWRKDSIHEVSRLPNTSKAPAPASEAWALL